MKYSSYHDLLADEFEKRKKKNASYSLRAYARDLGLSAPRLSQVLSKKQGLSIEVAGEIAKKLKLNEKKTAWFCLSVGEIHARSFKERHNYKNKILHYQEEAKIYSELQLEYFKVISDWFHFAILELTYLEGFKRDLDWIAMVLEIRREEAAEAVERLLKLGLMKEEAGTYVDTFKFLATPSDVPSDALKKFNSQLMQKAVDALKQRSVDEREIASNIFAFDKASIPRLKEKLRNFRREIEFEASQSKAKDSVFCLGMQFYELTRTDV